MREIHRYGKRDACIKMERKRANNVFFLRNQSPRSAFKHRIDFGEKTESTMVKNASELI